MIKTLIGSSLILAFVAQGAYGQTPAVFPNQFGYMIPFGNTPGLTPIINTQIPPQLPFWGGAPFPMNPQGGNSLNPNVNMGFINNIRRTTCQNSTSTGNPVMLLFAVDLWIQKMLDQKRRFTIVIVYYKKDDSTTIPALGVAVQYKFVFRLRNELTTKHIAFEVLINLADISSVTYKTYIFSSNFDADSAVFGVAPADFKNEFNCGDLKEHLRYYDANGQSKAAYSLNGNNRNIIPANIALQLREQQEKDRLGIRNRCDEDNLIYSSGYYSEPTFTETNPDFKTKAVSTTDHLGFKKYFYCHPENKPVIDYISIECTANLLVGYKIVFIPPYASGTEEVNELSSPTATEIKVFLTGADRIRIQATSVLFKISTLTSTGTVINTALCGAADDTTPTIFLGKLSEFLGFYSNSDPVNDINVLGVISAPESPFVGRRPN